ITPKTRVGPHLVDGIQSLAFDRDGSLLIGAAQSSRGIGLLELRDGNPRPFSRATFDGHSIDVQQLFVDSNRDLWIGTTAEGLYRVSNERVERYRAVDGLSSDTINRIFEDRDGNICFPTQEGVDRFRDIKVASYSTREGLSADQVNSVVASHDGSIWIGNGHALDVLRGDSVTSYRAGKELPGTQVTAQFEGRTGRRWIGVDDGLYRLEGGKFRALRRPDGKPVGWVTAMMDDPQGNLWIIQTGGKNGSLLRIAHESVEQEISFEQLAFAKTSAMASDASNGVWLPMFK